jgi:hypothetical protein
MQDEPDDEILATVAASAGRRFLGIGMLALLGVMVIYVALTNPPALGWQVFLLAFGTISLMVADAMRRATAFRLELTREELRDTGGEVIARVAEIKSVDRGAFAFKPSNGFLLRTSTSAPRRWRPGLWWRIGARIGVGGMTPGRQTRNMAEIIAIMIAERDQAS